MGINTNYLPFTDTAYNILFPFDFRGETYYVNSPK